MIVPEKNNGHIRSLVILVPKKLIASLNTFISM